MTRLARLDAVHRLDLGCFVRPSSETGTGRPRVEAVYGYLVVHPELTVVFDTGIGTADEETEAHYQPHRRPFALACREAGCDVGEIDVVVNSHLHFDHCGANPALPGRRIVVQAAELEAASRDHYTVPELIDFEGAVYDPISGEAELADGLVVVPTPGHSPGHQSLVVRSRDGTLLVAGQAMDVPGPTAAPVAGCASAYASAHLARRAAQGTGRAFAGWPEWLDRIEQFDPARVVFAHDGAIFEPPTAPHR
ncbi:MAG TPA: N-acyl homoserine lactonase family protein [Acidimicrobiales bacterium]|nr:N-acyl homoserine lactonase family protein [Acidimicrobiales bacterium]